MLKTLMRSRSQQMINDNRVMLRASTNQILRSIVRFGNQAMRDSLCPLKLNQVKIMTKHN